MCMLERWLKKVVISVSMFCVLMCESFGGMYAFVSEIVRLLEK